MPDYEKMYHLLFNAITDALEKLDAAEPLGAASILKNAQLQGEAMYVEAGAPAQNII